VRALAIHRSEGALGEIRNLLQPVIPCDTARTADEAMTRLSEYDYAVVILDHSPPENDGTQALNVTLGAAPEALVIVLSQSAQAAQRAADNAPGRVFFFGVGPDARWQLPGVVAQALRLVRLERQQKELVRKLGAEHLKLQKRERLLDVVVRERTRELELSYEKLKRANREALLGLAEAIEAKDPYTKGHCGRVAAFSSALARACGYPADEMETLEFASFLHDIGKLGVKDAVLLKPGPLDDDEWKHMRLHPVIGDQIASQIELLGPMRPAIRNHHERWDGRGYPDAMKGDGIPLAARIVCIADAFDAMVTDRPYKPALSLDVAHGFLRKGAAAQFDPNLVDIFIRNRIGE